MAEFFSNFCSEWHPAKDAGGGALYPFIIENLQNDVPRPSTVHPPPRTAAFDSRCHRAEPDASAAASTRPRGRWTATYDARTRAADARDSSLCAHSSASAIRSHLPVHVPETARGSGCRRLWHCARGLRCARDCTTCSSRVTTLSSTDLRHTFC